MKEGAIMHKEYCEGHNQLYQLESGLPKDMDHSFWSSTK